MIFFLYFFFLLYIEFFHRISSSPILLEHLSHHYTQQRAKKKTDSLLRSALRSRTPIDTTFLLPAAHRNGRATSSSNLHSSCNKVASLLRINDPRKSFCFRPINSSDRFLAATISPFYSSGNNNLSSPSVSTLFLFEKENRREMKFLFHFISR